MKKFEIVNTLSGHSFGVYTGASPEAALDVYAKDAGYIDFADAQTAAPTENGEILAIEIDD
jgi:hypothetical protein